MEIKNEEILFYKDLFVGRDGIIAKQVGKGYSAKRRPISNNDIRNHLSGKSTYGTYVICKDGKTCKYVVIDIDEKEDDNYKKRLADVRKVDQTLKSLGINENQRLLEFSGRRGYHIWIHFEHPIEASKARKLGQILVRLSGLSSKTEVFPKQHSTTYENPGSLIKMPLCRHDASGEWSCFMDSSFSKIDDGQQLLKNYKKVSEVWVDQILSEHSSLKIYEKEGVGELTHEDISELTPCFKKIFKAGVSKGSRDIITFNFAQHLKNKLKWKKERIISFLVEWDKRNEESLGEKVIEEKVDSVFKKNYNGTGCKEPMVQRYCTGNCELCADMCPKSYQELLDQDFSDYSSLWGDGILDPQSRMFVAGDPKIKKSFFALDLGFSLALGRDFLGFSVLQKIKVFYLQCEINDFRLQQRFREIVSCLGKPEEGYFHFKSQKNFDIMKNNDFQRLKQTLMTYRYDVLIIDPFLMVHQCNENEAHIMRAVFKRLDELIEDCGVSIVICHHYSKQIKGGASKGVQRMRGSSSIRAWADSNLCLDKKGDGVQLSWELRNAEEPKPMTIKCEDSIFRAIGAESSSKFDLKDLIRIMKRLDKKEMSRDEISEKAETDMNVKKTTVQNVLNYGRKNGFLASKPNGKSLLWSITQKGYEYVS